MMLSIFNRLSKKRAFVLKNYLAKMEYSLLNKAQNTPYLPHLDIPGAFPHSPTISHEETELVRGLMEKDAKEHHIFFNDKGFHNHLVHMLLADYSLGASLSRLQEVYKIEEKMQKPKLDKHDNFKWTDHLGDENYYSDYLEFMNQEVQRLGRVEAVEKYAFDEKHNMLARWLGGAYHPFIHTGYGLEFGSDGIVAEGLAEMCVHGETSKPLFPHESLLSNILSKLPHSQSSETALDIAKSTLNDTRFDGLVTFEDSPKFSTLLKKNPELVLEYAHKWSLPTDSEGLLKKAVELMILGATVYAGPQRPEKEIVLDFFLMHALTSSLFLPVVIKSVNSALGARVLRGKFAIDLAYFISRNRPKLHLEQFSSPSEFNKSWDQIFDLAIKHNDEHVPKVVRALKQVERWDSNQTLGKGAYRAMASMTVDYVAVDKDEEKDGKRWWNQDGIGFDEVWKNIPNRK